MTYMLIHRLKHLAFIARELYLIFWLKQCYNVNAFLYLFKRQMTQLQSVVESSKSELLSYFRGREYQPLTVGIVSPTMPSTASDKGIEKWLDFDMEDKESISDLMDALREPIKSSEKTANVSDKFETRKDAENVSNLQSYTNVENDDTWSQITSLPMEELQHTSAASEGKESKRGESSYEIEEEDTKDTNQTYYLGVPSPVTMIPRYKGDSAALTESNSSGKRQIRSNALRAKSPINKSI